MLFSKLNVQILNFNIVGNSAWLDSSFIYLVCVSLHLEENKSAFKALESSFFEVKNHLYFFPWYIYHLKYEPFKNQNDTFRKKN